MCMNFVGSKRLLNRWTDDIINISGVLVVLLVVILVLLIKIGVLK